MDTFISILLLCTSCYAENTDISFIVLSIFFFFIHRFCKPVQDNLENVEALIVGPPETPYEFGYFLFDMKFNSTYPDKPPKVLM